MKGISKKVLNASKEKGNGNLSFWVKAIRSSLYWCALSSKQGFGEMIFAKWKSVIRYISNSHTNHSDPLYSKCAHGQLEQRDWLTTHFTSMCIPHFFLASERRSTFDVRRRPGYKNWRLFKFSSILLSFKTRH